jgi:simple sugar transport system permease protein
MMSETQAKKSFDGEAVSGGGTGSNGPAPRRNSVSLPLLLRLARTSVQWQSFGLVVALVVVGTIFSLMAPNFLTSNNLLNILQQSSFLGIIAFGMTLVILAAEIDVSVGSAMALDSALLGVLAGNKHWPLAATALLVIVMGTSIGLLAGFVRAKFNVPSFIVTLALLSALSGAALWITDAIPVALTSPALATLGAGSEGGIPVPVFFLVAAFLGFWFIANRTTFGRSCYAVGGNPAAARAAGVSVMRVRVMVFGFTGFLSAVSAILLSGSIGSGNPDLGSGAEFEVIAAVIIGGTSLYGGRGSVAGTAVGVLFVGVLDNGMILLNVNQYAESVAHGMIILLAVLMTETVAARSRRVTASGQRLRTLSIVGAEVRRFAQQLVTTSEKKGD